MKISIVVAMSENGVIGKDNKIPWHVPDDLRRFKKITEGHHVLMGRKTFESILETLKKPLPNRTNLVLSRDENYKHEGVFVFQDFNEAVNYAKKQNEVELMVIGGREIYRLALPQAETLYTTRILRNVEGDTFFPLLNMNEWRVVEHQFCSGKPETSHEFRKLERK